MDETWLYHYEPDKKQNQWSGGIVAYPCPTILSANINPLENIWPRFFGSGRHPPHCLSSERPNYKRVILLISAGAI
jgi:hypothetical protein